jgi:hypothetical protein
MRTLRYVALTSRCRIGVEDRMDQPAVVALLFGSALQIITAYAARAPRSARIVLILLSWAAIIYSLAAFTLWGAIAMRWNTPLLAAILAGALLGGASGAVAFKQLIPSEAETQLRADIRGFISSGEAIRDNWLTDARALMQGSHNSHIVLYRESEIERWRERLQRMIAEQKVLNVDDTTAYVTTTEGDRISGSITALKALLRDWRTFKL